MKDNGKQAIDLSQKVQRARDGGCRKGGLGKGTEEQNEVLLCTRINSPQECNHYAPQMCSNRKQN